MITAPNHNFERLDVASKVLRARHASRGFTMVEIALCLAIIGFAMVAIIGVLPIGVRVQQDNREETIINQDGAFLLDAIRSGAQGLDYLTNHVDSITISNSLRQSVTMKYGKTPEDQTFSKGAEVIGLLGTPRLFYLNGRYVTNTVSAIMRSFSGSAQMEARASREFAFNYRVVSEVTAFSVMPPSFTNYLANGLTATERQTRSNNWRFAETIGPNFHDIRLTFQWPVFVQGNRLIIGNNRKTFRTLSGGTLPSSGDGLFIRSSSVFRPQVP